MFDNDATGTIDVYEFEKLYNYINQWLQVFKTYDKDGSGHIEENELTQGEFLKVLYITYYVICVLLQHSHKWAFALRRNL